MVEPSQQPGMLGEIQRLKALLEEISVSLRSQRDILKTRGMALPPMTMQAISSITMELDQLEKTLTSEQTEVGQLRSLADNAAMINSSFDLNQVLSNAMDVVISLTGAERGYIILRKENSDELDFSVRRENEVSPAARSVSTEVPQISMTIVREVLDSGEPLLADNAYKDERLQNNLSVAALSLRSVLCVPLNYKGIILGCVYVDNRLRSGVFEQRERNLLAAFANQVSVAMENARLYTHIKKSVSAITEMKDLIDNVFESIGSGVITTDAKDAIMTFNRAAAGILGKFKREEVIHKPLAEALPGDFTEYLKKARNNDERQVVDTELEIKKRGRIYVNMKISPLKNTEQSTQGVAIVLDDVTEQRERDEMIDIMKRYLPPQMVDNIHSIARLDLGGERREVTCIFIEVRPLSSLPPGLAPAQIMETVNTFLGTATACIHEAKGVIDKYMGTEIMAMFNTQLNPMPNHATQAVEAALLIREAFIKLYADLGIDPNPHYYRIGMHTGVATLGNVGSSLRRDFTAIGDTINLSKRLEENAKSGQIIISEDTRRHLEQHLNGNIRFQELDPIQVKGRQQQTRIYEIFRL